MSESKFIDIYLDNLMQESYTIPLNMCIDGIVYSQVFSYKPCIVFSCMIRVKVINPKENSTQIIRLIENAQLGDTNESGKIYHQCVNNCVIEITTHVK